MAGWLPGQRARQKDRSASELMIKATSSGKGQVNLWN